MKTRNEILNLINNNELSEEDLVSLLILIDSKLELNTLSKQAKKDNKTRRGILVSNNYRKIELENITLVSPKLKNVKNNLPF
jgi:hypothetical protein